MYFIWLILFIVICMISGNIWVCDPWKMMIIPTMMTGLTVLILILLVKLLSLLLLHYYSCYCCYFCCLLWFQHHCYSNVITTTTTTIDSVIEAFIWVPECILGFLDALLHLHLTAVLWSIYSYYHRFIAEKIEAQKD